MAVTVWYSICDYVTGGKYIETDRKQGFLCENPFAKNSFYCLGLGIASLLLGALSMYFSVKNAGQGGLNTGAYGFSSMAAAIMGLWYGILSFTEDDCNYILARIGMALEGIILLVWVIIIFTGIFR